MNKVNIQGVNSSDYLVEANAESIISINNLSIKDTNSPLLKFKNANVSLNNITI